MADHQQRNRAQRQFENLQRLNNTGFDSIDTDLYSILGVGSDATIKEIERQYRHLSLHVHPDK